jgi:hypothetical protein
MELGPNQRRDYGTKRALTALKDWQESSVVAAVLSKEFFMTNNARTVVGQGFRAVEAGKLFPPL